MFHKLLTLSIFSSFCIAQSAIIRDGCAATTASGTAYACSYPVSPTLITGHLYWFKADIANTAASTINFNGLGAKTIKKLNGNITTDLVANDLISGQWVALIYDGVNMQMLSALGNAPAPTASPTFTGTVTQPSFNSTINCSSSASPAICTSAAAGSVAFPTGITSVALQINTTAVTANSQIFIATDDTLGTKLGVICNSNLATLVGGIAITGRSVGTSFTVTYNGTIATNPLCASFFIIN